MDLFWMLVYSVGVLLLTILVVLTYSGFFYTYSIRCTIPASLPKRFAYTVHVGPYSQVHHDCSKLAKAAPGKRQFGVYYDDPKTTPAAKLRAVLGCYLSDTPNEAEDLIMRKHGYQIYEFPRCNKALVAEYVYRNFLSYLFAIKRVYPALGKYIKEHKIREAGPFVEIHHSDMIQFVVILDKHEEFYPPEIYNLSFDDEDKKTQ